MRRVSGGTAVYLHREIMQPGDLVVDHIFGDRIDNRRPRMRVTTEQVNAQNRRRRSRRNKSGVIGVSFKKETGKWVAALAVNEQQIWVGSFSTIGAAAKALHTARAIHHAEAIAYD